MRGRLSKYQGPGACCEIGSIGSPRRPLQGGQGRSRKRILIRMIVAQSSRWAAYYNCGNQRKGRSSALLRRFPGVGYCSSRFARPPARPLARWLAGWLGLVGWLLARDGSPGRRLAVGGWIITRSRIKDARRKCERAFGSVSLACGGHS